MRLRADSQADLDRFIRRVAEKDEVWALRSAEGMATCKSFEFEVDDEPSTVLLFFSDAAYARRVQGRHFPAHAPHP